MAANSQNHPYHSLWKRGLFSIVIVSAVMLIGIVGVHHLEQLSFLDAFYLMSMIATGQGPLYAPATSAGKVFIAVMAFVSVGAVTASLGFLFGPFFGRLWHVGVLKVEAEIEELRRRKPQ